MSGEGLSPSDFLAALCLGSLCLVFGCMLFKAIVMSPPLSLNVWWCFCLYFKLYKNPMAQKDLG